VNGLSVREPLGVVDMVTYYGPIKEYKAKNMIKGDWEHKNRVIEYLANNGKGEIVDLVEPTADNKIQTETWLLAEYRNIQTGHRQFISVDCVDQAEWILRCMNRNGVLFEFVELYKKDGV
jgi:hypothetical protein